MMARRHPLSPLSQLLLLLLTASISNALSAASSGSRILWVANTGIDSATCGTSTVPCRSITQAIDNAADGDTILVRPGRYGDIDDDGVRDPGDEEINAPAGCLLCVNKSLHIFSTQGAAVTTIDAGGRRAVSRVVQISADDTKFGAPGTGFTVTGGAQTGIGVSNPAGPLVRHVRVEGNVALNNGRTGIVLDGVTVSFYLNYNTAIGNLNGFDISFDGAAAYGGKMTGNVASANSGWGFRLTGNYLDVNANLADNNVQGMLLQGEGMTLLDNTVTNSRREGIVVEAGPERDEFTLKRFMRNSVVGNRGAGLTIGAGASVGAMTNNNFFGNGTSAVRIGAEPRTNCGLVNASGQMLLAANNFWGSSQGPGQEPADEGPACDARPGSVTTVAPFARQSFKVSTGLQ